jgi:hypothetical protein
MQANMAGYVEKSTKKIWFLYRDYIDKESFLVITDIMAENRDVIFLNIKWPHTRLISQETFLDEEYEVYESYRKYRLYRRNKRIVQELFKNVYIFYEEPENRVPFSSICKL